MVEAALRDYIKRQKWQTVPDNEPERARLLRCQQASGSDASIGVTTWLPGDVHDGLRWLSVHWGDNGDVTDSTILTQALREYLSKR